MTNIQIFDDIKNKEPNILTFIDAKQEEFQSFLKEFPDKAFKILSMFQDNDLNSAPYWGGFIFEASKMTDEKKSKKWFFRIF